MFQSFDEAGDRSASKERVGRLRAGFDAAGIDGFIVPRADAHQGEYIPASAARLAYLTGFTGSAGVALVLRGKAAIFVDGRYTVQARAQVDPEIFAYENSVERPLFRYLREEGQGLRIGFDPWLHTIGEVKELGAALEAAGGSLVAIDANPIDAIWPDRPAPPVGRVRRQPERYAGRSAGEKLDDMKDALAREKADLVVLTDPSSIAWLFNIRGSDVPHTPLPLSFAILNRKARAQLFIDPAKLDGEVRSYLGAFADLSGFDTFEAALAEAAKGSRVMLDPALAAERLKTIVTEAGGSVVEQPDPARLPRAIKNAAELAGTRAAHRRDGAAVTEFLHWLDGKVPGTVTEIGAAEQLEVTRAAFGEAAQMPLRDLSFDTISGSGPNAALPHYRVNRGSDRRLADGELYLVDSGAQYEDGTTDITRTVAIGTPSEEMCRKFTLVLKGMIAISTARFPKGTRGLDLDPLARIALWKAGCDYAHGTGHGIGSYLAVHEGPQSISRRGMAVLEPGMILSNEPGYYREGHFGIRIENLVVTEPLSPIPDGDMPMHSFETLTLAPIDRRLVVTAMLTPEETLWLDRYHAWVRETLSPLLATETRAWLAEVTEPLEARMP